MATIKKLKLKLMSGLLSDLQSDTIFGHFAWRLKERFGEEKLEEFLDLFVSNSPVFTVSDGFFEKNDELFFPKPLKLTPAKFQAKNKKERIIQFLKQKESKARQLITLKELNFYLLGNIDAFEKTVEKKSQFAPPGYITDLRVSVQIDRTTLKSKDKALFTYYPKYLDSETFLNVFVKILNMEKWKEFACEEIFSQVFEIGYGKKKSSGYGQFEIIEFNDFNGFEEVEESDGFISLSHYLPANSDEIIDAYYDINVKYGKFGEEKANAQNPFKPPMLFMKPGSCFVTKEKKEFYGRAIRGVSDYLPNAVHNGIAFSLNAKFN